MILHSNYTIFIYIYKTFYNEKSGEERFKDQKEILYKRVEILTYVTPALVNFLYLHRKTFFTYEYNISNDNSLYYYKRNENIYNLSYQFNRFLICVSVGYILFFFFFFIIKPNLVVFIALFSFFILYIQGKREEFFFLLLSFLSSSSVQLVSFYACTLPHFVSRLKRVFSYYTKFLH